jgi:hypothetical protein
MKRELWFCPNCSKTSTRHSNLKTHINRKRGTRQPIRRSGLDRQFAADVNLADNACCGTGNQKVYPDTANPVIQGRNRTTDNDPFAIWDISQEVVDRLVQLKGLLCKYSSLHEVQPILLGCWNAFQASGETVLLDAYLASSLARETG